MSTPEWPTTYELCRIAAALKAADVKLSPPNAVKAAMALWSAAFDELNAEKAAIEARESVQGQTEWNEKRERERHDSLGQMLRSATSNHELSAMKWLQEHAKDPLDKFKAVVPFRKAWAKFRSADGMDADVPDAPELWHQFEEYRVAKRKAKDADRQRGVRAAKNRSRKIAGGRGGNARRKKIEKAR